MRFAKFIFWSAALYGFVVTFPLCFAEHSFAVDYPSPINHPEHFYSFIGVTLA